MGRPGRSVTRPGPSPPRAASIARRWIVMNRERRHSTGIRWGFAPDRSVALRRQRPRRCALDFAGGNERETYPAGHIKSFAVRQSCVPKWKAGGKEMILAWRTSDCTHIYAHYLPLLLALISRIPPFNLPLQLSNYKCAYGTYRKIFPLRSPAI